MAFSISAPDLGQFSLTDTLQLRLLHYGAIRIDASNWNFADLIATYWRIYVNFDDGAAIRLPGRRQQPLHAGRCYLLPPWLHYASRCSTPVRHFFLHFDLPRLADQAGAPALQRVVSVPEAPGLARALRQLATDLVGNAHPDQGQVAAAKACCFQVLAAAHGELNAMERQALFVREGDLAVRRVCRFVDAHLAEDLPVARLARIAGLSEPQLTRRFRQDLRLAPAAWVRGRRVAQAAARLAAGERDVVAVAQACGFADRFQFGRVFKRLTGMSPGRYRDLRGSELQAGQPG